MLPLIISEFTLPLQHPVLKFMVILMIILFAPILLNKIKIPHILGLIIAGAIIGPNGINLLARDSSIILSGTAGLLYIMFLAGLEIDLGDLKKNGVKSFGFGMYTFLIPMTIGTLTGYYLLDFSLPTSVLLASMFASHTLITYPIVTKLDVVKSRAVNIAVGGTIITDTLALLVLAVIIGMETGNSGSAFWTQLTISLLIFTGIVLFIFPIIGRWFFKHYSDPVSQYIFVLVMVFLGAVLAEAAGIEAIIGAFLSGLALNRLIPSTSPLMNRISFVGNAVFIPFFLIGVGMLVDYRAFFRDWETLKVAGIMTVVATLSKYLAAWFTRKTFRLTKDEGGLIFGLSNAQAAATLAAVLVGYNVILGYDDAGTPIRLLNDSVLNGSIVMILITCTIASFVTQRTALRISISENTSSIDVKESDSSERILIPLRYPETVDELINLSSLIKSKDNISNIMALHIIDNNKEESFQLKRANKILEKAVITASAVDINLQRLIRYDVNIVNGISSIIREQNITDLLLAINEEKGISDAFFGKLTQGILTRNNTTTLVYKSIQPISTIRRHVIIVPEGAELEIGFPFWLIKVWNISRNSGCKLVFYAHEKTINILREVHKKHPVEVDFHTFNEWNDFLILSRDIRTDDNLILILSREKSISYHPNMENMPGYLSKYFSTNSYLLIYPMQIGLLNHETGDLNPSLVEPIEKLDEIGKTIARLFRKR
jgi:Kef-type K+ transport system membrane component KefB